MEQWPRQMTMRFSIDDFMYSCQNSRRLVEVITRLNGDRLTGAFPATAMLNPGYCSAPQSPSHPETVPSVRLNPLKSSDSNHRVTMNTAPDGIF